MSSAQVKRIVYILALLVALVPGALAAAQDVEHTVQRGDTLFRISQLYGVSSDVIAQANNLSNITRIFPGDVLVIPDLTDAVETPLFAAEPTHHVIQPGETLGTIASRYGLTIDQLSRLNNISNPNRILWGQTLTVFDVSGSSESSAGAATSNTSETDFPLVDANMTYIVQPGESLADIAVRLGVSWTTLVEVNGISNPNHIEIGQHLVIPEAGSILDNGIVAPSFYVPPATLTVGRELIVDISESRVYAYENGRLVHTAMGSLGLPATPTVKGSFTVQRKYESQTMSGPGYYLPGVQWIMYFYAGYALHGAYWHNNWGQPMSHGCVNLPNEEALWFYEWAPVGTPVLVQA
jgi:LysM repeat protein